MRFTGYLEEEVIPGHLGDLGVGIGSAGRRVSFVAKISSHVAFGAA